MCNLQNIIYEEEETFPGFFGKQKQKQKKFKLVDSIIVIVVDDGFNNLQVFISVGVVKFDNDNDDHFKIFFSQSNRCGDLHYDDDDDYVTTTTIIFCC